MSSTSPTVSRTALKPPVPRAFARSAPLLAAYMAGREDGRMATLVTTATGSVSTTACVSLRGELLTGEQARQTLHRGLDGRSLRVVEGGGEAVGVASLSATGGGLHIRFFTEEEDDGT